MKKVSFCILILFLFSFNRGNSQNLKNSFTVEEKVFTISTIWKEAGENFPYFDRFSPSYWDSLYCSNLTKVINTTTDYQFYEIIESFIASLYDSHTYFHLPADYETYKNADQSNPDFYTSWLSDGYYVIIASEEIEKKLPLGSKILEIDNIDIEQYASDHISKTALSQMPHVIRYYSDRLLFRGVKGSKFKLKYLTSKGKIEKTEIIRQKNPNSVKKFINKKILSFGSDSLYLAKNKDNIGYLNLAGVISAETIDFFNSKIDSIRTCKGLIIDLRNSMGGSSYGNQIIDYFSKVESYQSFAMKVRINNAFFKALGAYTDTAIVKNIGGNPRHFEYQNYYKDNAFDSIIYNSQRNIAPITIPVVVLVNPSVCSATETMLISFINAKAGVIIGQPTMGSCTQPLFIPLKNIGCFQVATQKPMYSDGTYFDYIHPDILVNPTLKGYMEGRDEILEAGYNYFKTHLK